MSGINPITKMTPSHPGFSIRQVQSFLAVADSGGFAAAAHLVNIGSSGLSRIISDLEHEMGEQLFERVAQGVRLTDAGRAFMPYARKLTDSYIRALQRLKSPQEVRIKLTISCALAGVLHSLVTACHAARDPHDLQIKVVECHQVVAFVTTGDADIGLAMLPEHRGGVFCETLLEVPLGLLVPPTTDLPAASINLKDLQRLHFVRLADDMVIPDLLHKHGVVLPRYFNAVLTCTSMTSLMELVAAGNIVTIVPAPAAHSVLASGMRFLPLPQLLPVLKLVMITRTDTWTPNLDGWRTTVRQHILRQPWASA